MSKQIEIRLVQVERRMLALCDGPEGVLLSAVEHHLLSGGGRVRARLALEASAVLARPETEAIALATACELLHNASLIHDDLQDRDAERRGQPAVWAKFGPEIAICAGDLMLSAAYGALAAIGAHAAPLLTHIHSCTAMTIQGQTNDLVGAKHADITLTEYEAIAVGKSGPLLSLPVELALYLAEAREHIPTARKAINSFALGYQMLDDLEDADADAISGEVNAVAILAASGAADARRAVRDRALMHLDHATDFSRALPNALPGIVARYVDLLLQRSGLQQDVPA